MCSAQVMIMLQKSLSLGGMKTLSGNGSQTLVNRKKMRKFSSFMAAAVAMLAAVSCNKEINNIDPVTPGADAVVYTAYVDGAETKTVLGNDEDESSPTPALWSGNEWIQIVGRNGNYWFGTDVKEPSDKAEFSYNGNNGEFNENDVIAVYPAGSTNYAGDFATKTVSGVSIPTEQILVASTYPADAAVAMAYSDDKTLQFKNATALLKFKVSGDPVIYGSFYGTENVDKLTGTYEVAYNGGTPTVNATNGVHYVNFNLQDTELSVNDTYYVAIAPGKVTNFSVSLNGNKVITHDGEFTFERNKIYNLGTINYEAPEVSTWSIAGTNNGWNKFATPMQLEGDYYVAKNVVFSEDGEFKLVHEGLDWYNSNGAFSIGKWVGIISNDGSNISIPEGAYDFYISESNLYVTITGSYTPLAPGVIPADAGWIYLKPNSNWAKDNAWFAIYLCNGDKGATWIKMSSVEGTSYYGVKLPDDFSVANYKNIIFCRMNPASQTLDWSNKWNQSGDLDSGQIVSGKNCCAINAGQWDCGSNVTWSKVNRLN